MVSLFLFFLHYPPLLKGAVMEQQQTPELSIEEACAVVGIDTDLEKPQMILAGFEIAWNANPPDRKKLILAKNLIMRQMVSEQMKAQRYFEITSPFQHSCISCRGTGEIYKFNRKPVFVNCHICAGKKKVTVECRTCKGSGRYITEDSSTNCTLRLNLKCTTCKGKGKVRVKCSECFGKGKKKKIVPDHTIKSTTPCKHCNELGFILPKPGKRKKETPPIGNPVISTETAAALTDMIKSS